MPVDLRMRPEVAPREIPPDGGARARRTPRQGEQPWPNAPIRSKQVGAFLMPVMGVTPRWKQVGVMPKENINSDATDPDTGEALSRLELSWRDADTPFVQMGAVLRETVEATGDHPAHTRYGDGVYVLLNRAGINRLIRSLRKARDAAFGSDA